ncbi:MAG: hypothetical protein AB4050_18725 [Synechococcus sp.]
MSSYICQHFRPASFLSDWSTEISSEVRRFRSTIGNGALKLSVVPLPDRRSRVILEWIQERDFSLEDLSGLPCNLNSDSECIVIVDSGPVLVHRLDLVAAK